MTKDESLIPIGGYCYELLGVDRRESDELPILNTKVCPYWSLLDNGSGYCAFMEFEDLLILGDQCKLCGINDPDDDYQEEEQ